MVTARTCTGAGQRAGARRHPHLALAILLPLCFTPCLRGLPFYLVQDSGLEPADIRTWRRKFVWFPADSQRPPFYGSCKPRWVVCAVQQWLGAGAGGVHCSAVAGRRCRWCEPFSAPAAGLAGWLAVRAQPVAQAAGTPQFVVLAALSHGPHRVLPALPLHCSPTVGPRRPFAKDDALDYEVMSDLDWEEEPEGGLCQGLMCPG